MLVRNCCVFAVAHEASSAGSCALVHTYVGVYMSIGVVRERKRANERKKERNRGEERNKGGR